MPDRANGACTQACRPMEKLDECVPMCQGESLPYPQAFLHFPNASFPKVETEGPWTPKF